MGKALTAPLSLDTRKRPRYPSAFRGPVSATTSAQSRSITSVSIRRRGYGGYPAPDTNHTMIHVFNLSNWPASLFGEESATPVPKSLRGPFDYVRAASCAHKYCSSCSMGACLHTWSARHNARINSPSRLQGGSLRGRILPVNRTVHTCIRETMHAFHLPVSRSLLPHTVDAETRGPSPQSAVNP